MIDNDTRERILATPETLLNDPDIMAALVNASEQARGKNVIDLRGVAMTQLEGRLDILERTHRNTLSAAYENLVGTQQLHRAMLQMLEPLTLDAFLSALAGEVLEILQIDGVRLVLEASPHGEPAKHQEKTFSTAALSELGKKNTTLFFALPGFINDYINRGNDVPKRQVTLRQIIAQQGQNTALYAENSRIQMASEGVLMLDFGNLPLRGFLAMGSRDPMRFSPNHATDLLVFMAGVAERVLRHHFHNTSAFWV